MFYFILYKCKETCIITFVPELLLRSFFCSRLLNGMCFYLFTSKKLTNQKAARSGMIFYEEDQSVERDRIANDILISWFLAFGGL